MIGVAHMSSKNIGKVNKLPWYTDMCLCYQVTELLNMITGDTYN